MIPPESMNILLNLQQNEITEWGRIFQNRKEYKGYRQSDKLQQLAADELRNHDIWKGHSRPEKKHCSDLTFCCGHSRRAYYASPSSVKLNERGEDAAQSSTTALRRVS
jgi:hypothetical protein